MIFLCEDAKESRIPTKCSSGVAMIGFKVGAVCDHDFVLYPATGTYHRDIASFDRKQRFVGSHGSGGGALLATRAVEL